MVWRGGGKEKGSGQGGGSRKGAAIRSEGEGWDSTREGGGGELAGGREGGGGEWAKGE